MEEDPITAYLEATTGELGEDPAASYDIFYNGNYAYSTPGYGGEGAPPPIDPFSGNVIDPWTGDIIGPAPGWVAPPGIRPNAQGGLPMFPVRPLAQAGLRLGQYYPQAAQAPSPMVQGAQLGLTRQLYQSMLMKRLTDELKELRRIQQMWNPWLADRYPWK